MKIMLLTGIKQINGLALAKSLKIFVVDIYMHLYSKFHSESFDYPNNLVVFNLWLLEKDK